MKEWYSNKKVGIYFSEEPHVEVREFHYNPELSQEENKKIKKNIEKYPFELMNDVLVEIVDMKTQVHYHFSMFKNFCYDGASIPDEMLIRKIIGANTDNRFRTASLVHDVLCKNKNYIDYNRKLSTEVFNALLEATQVNAFKRWLMKHSVDNFQKFCGWGC